jgi:hypothetical protein
VGSDPFLFSLHIELGYTVMETSGAAGECLLRVRLSGTQAGKTQRLQAAARAGPRILEENNSLSSTALVFS